MSTTNNIGGFISAPIKLAAMINNRRNDATKHPNQDNTCAKKSSHDCVMGLPPSGKPSEKNCSGQLRQRRHNKRRAKVSRAGSGGGASPKHSHPSPNLSSLCSYHHLLAALLLLWAGHGPALAADTSNHLLRHHAHYLNIVPSTHFQYNEGRQMSSGGGGGAGQVAPAPEVGSAMEQQASNSHIYKRSSALISSPGAGAAAHYLPLISSHHGSGSPGNLNPLRRRMMSPHSGGDVSGLSATSGQHHPTPQRWLSMVGGGGGAGGELEQERSAAGELLLSAAGSEHSFARLVEPAPEAVGGSSRSSRSQTAPAQRAKQQRRPSEQEEAELLRQKQHIQYHDQWPSVAGKCHKRTLNFCASVLPFNTTTFPNIIGDTNRFEVKRSLPFFGFLAKSSCNKRLDELLCLLLEPPCSSHSGSAIPPCKKFCRLALEGCNEYIPATLAMSSVFDCRQYPDSNDPSVCINLAQGSKCAPDEFKCPDKTCIPRNWLCDGVRDCLFAADEANCTAPTGVGLQTSVCSTEEFKCDGKCVPKAWKCDGERDCLDGSDEEACDQRPRCGPDRFRCADGNGCLPKRWVCDGKAECRDGSDEMNCEEQECSENDFKCDNGICIPKLWRCDRQADCKDGSDERSCVYPQSTTTTTTPPPPPPSTTSTTTTAAPTTLRAQQSANDNELASYYLNATYSISGAPAAKQVVDAEQQQQPTTQLMPEQQQPTILELSPMSYYSGDSGHNHHQQSQQQQPQQPPAASLGVASREQLESNVGDDVSRIIKQESSSQAPPTADEIHLGEQQQQQQQLQASTSGPGSSETPAVQRPKEMNKFDYDIIQSAPASAQSNLIQLADLMVSNEMATRHQKEQPIQIDFAPQQQTQPQPQPQAAARQASPLNAHPTQQQQQPQQQQVAFSRQQAAASGGQRVASQAKAEPGERVPIYRSLFKTLKHGQGRLAAAQHRHHQASARRRRGDRHVPPVAQQVVPPMGSSHEQEQQIGSRFPHWSSSSSAPDEAQAVASSPAAPLNPPVSHSPFMQHHQQPQQYQQQQVASSNQTRHHGVASYLQLLNSRYNLRLPRVSAAPAL